MLDLKPTSDVYTFGPGVEIRFRRPAHIERVRWVTALAKTQGTKPKEGMEPEEGLEPEEGMEPEEGAKREDGVADDAFDAALAELGRRQFLSATGIRYDGRDLMEHDDPVAILAAEAPEVLYALGRHLADAAADAVNALTRIKEDSLTPDPTSSPPISPLSCEERSEIVSPTNAARPTSPM